MLLTLFVRSQSILKPRSTRSTWKGKPKSIPAIPLVQGSKKFYIFAIQASELYQLVQINRRSEDKREGYQRALSPSRVRSVARYLLSGGAIPGAIAVSFDAGNFDPKQNRLKLPGSEDIGWVIDGQHRLAGAFEASEQGIDVELPVIAALDANIESQIELFITINREARGVPASLYIDLLKDIPRKKTERELSDERIADIAKPIS